jgi:hypothetical protein
VNFRETATPGRKRVDDNAAEQNWPIIGTRRRDAVAAESDQRREICRTTHPLTRRRIDLTGSARGTSATSYAIPVNDALAVASQLKRS